MAEDAVFDGVVAGQGHAIEHKTSLIYVGLGNLDLGTMVNGYPSDTVKDKPFDKSFTRKSILSW